MDHTSLMLVFPYFCKWSYWRVRCVSLGWHEASERELPRVVLSFRPDVLGLYRKFFNGTAVHGRGAREPAEVMGLQICMQKLIMDRDDRLLYARDLVNTLLGSPRRTTSRCRCRIDRRGDALRLPTQRPMQNRSAQ